MAWLVPPAGTSPTSRTHPVLPGSAGTDPGESAGPRPRLPSLLLSPLLWLSSWLEENDDPVVARLNLRMQHITGLTVKTAELLQVWPVPGTPGWEGVLLPGWSPMVPRARPREACPTN